MHRNLDTGLSALHQQLLTMAGYVEQAVECATDAWRDRNVAKTKEVFAIEDKVNEAHIQVDAACLNLLALQQPLAKDLRLIVAVLKINTDLERMVDLAVNMVQNTEYYLKSAASVSTTDLSEMSDEVRVMVHEVLDAFVNNDDGLANSVLKRDDKVDEFKRKIFRDVVEYLKTNPAALEQGLNVILIAKNLERIGDHATNIAEDVIFSMSGEDIRHAGTKPGRAK